MDTTNNKTTLSWWRIALAVICGIIFSFFSYFILINNPENALSYFLTNYLKLGGTSGGILFLLTTTLAGTLFGAAFGRKPRFLHGQVTGIIVFVIQIGIWLYFRLVFC